VIEPPLARWGSVRPDARAAYWSLFAAALAADPALRDHASSPLARLALRLRPERGGPFRAAAIALLGVARLVGLAGLAAKRVVRGLRRRRF
jgi:hypothetical protein